MVILPGGENDGVPTGLQREANVRSRGGFVEEDLLRRLVKVDLRVLSARQASGSDYGAVYPQSRAKAPHAFAAFFNATAFMQ